MNKIDDTFAHNFGLELEVFREWFILYSRGNGAPQIKGKLIDGRAKDVGLEFDSAFDSKLTPDLAIEVCVAKKHLCIFVPSKGHDLLWMHVRFDAICCELVSPGMESNATSFSFFLADSDFLHRLVKCSSGSTFIHWFLPIEGEDEVVLVVRVALPGNVKIAIDFICDRYNSFL